MRPILILYFLFFCSALKAQNLYPSILWDKDYGGISDEDIVKIVETKDGGVLASGYTYSISSGDVSQSSFGGSDFWILRLDINGEKLWDKRFGGSDLDQIVDVIQTTDCGFMVAGISRSDSGGSKTQNGWGDWDYWLLKIDSSGNIQWDKDYGGDGNDYFTSIGLTADGGYIVGGFTNSGVSGNKTQSNWGGFDEWILKLDSLGNYEWDMRYGGVENDMLSTIVQCPDKGYLLGGRSESDSSGDKSQDNWSSNYDYWVIKIDSTGNKIWDKHYGSLGHDFSSKAQLTSDGGFALIGLSNGNAGGDKSMPIVSQFDIWIVKCDENGIIQWDNQYGAYGMDEGVTSFEPTEQGGYLIGCTSYSSAGSAKSENNLGPEQSWIIVIDSLGNKLWDKTILTATPIDDEFSAATQSVDGCFWIASSTIAGIGGNKTQITNGGADFFILKLCDTSTLNLPQSLIQPITTKICPDSCIAFTNQSTNATNYEWFFPAANPSYSTDENPTNICYYAPGTYDVTLIAHNGPYSDTVVATNLIQVYASPSPTIVQSNDSLLVTNVTGSNTFQWFYDSWFVSGATSPFFIPTQNGVYTVTVTSAEGCSALDTVTFIIDNVGNIFAQSNFQLYPNPTSESFTITTSHQGVSRLSIYNTLGQLVSNGLVDRHQSIYVSDLPAGIYHITVEVDGEFYSQRLLISRP